MRQTNPLRQRLVNLLYLLLIAYVVLIMPVEFIETYTDLNRSLERANYRLDESNQKVLQVVRTVSEYEPERYGQTYSKINQVRQITAEAIYYLDTLKSNLVQEAGGYSPYGHLVKALDPLLPTRRLYRSGQATEIKDVIETAKYELMQILDEPNRRMLDTILVTQDTLRKASGVVFEWEKYYFDNVPLAAVVTMLSKFQHDLRIAENAVTGTLHDLMETYLELPHIAAILDTISDDPGIGDIYVDKGLPGDTYQVGEQGVAFIRLPEMSKSDLERDFEVIIYDDRGRIERRIQFEDGVAKVELDTETPGEKVVRGMVQRKAEDVPDADRIVEDDRTAFDIRRADEEKAFEIEYQVKELTPVISQEKFNNFYIGVDNPINIVKPDREDREYRVSVSNGELHQVGDQYYVRVGRPGRVRVSLQESRPDGSFRTLTEQTFVARHLPRPVAQIYNRTSGDMPASIFKAQNQLTVRLDDLDIDPRYRIISYDVVYINGTGLGIFREPVQGSYFSANSRELIDLAQPGDIYVFDNIEIRGPDGRNERVNPLILNIE